jgi:pyruvate dehydrogenase E1 component
LIGGTSGRTTLNGEGLQHEDGHSQLIATTVPTVQAYDPAYAYELAVIIQDGLRRMYQDDECLIYYLSVYNETYDMPAMPEGSQEGILKGMYKARSVESDGPQGKMRPQLLGSGPILREAARAQEILAEKYGVSSDLWSVTSYTQLCREAREIKRWNRLHPGEPARQSYLEKMTEDAEGPFVATSDNVQLVAEQIRPWLPGTYITLGTDGFGRSSTREALRRHFEIDAAHTAFATLSALSQHCQFDKGRLPAAAKELGLDPEVPNPAIA